MSFRFSLGSSAEEARRPLLENASDAFGTPATAPRSSSQRSPSFLSSFFGSDSDSRPGSPVPVDIRGFETFPVTFAEGIALNVLADPAAEVAIVREVLRAGTTDPSIICDILRRIGVSEHFFPGKHEKEIKKLVCQVLDEINFYREGCSQVQIANMLDELQQKENSVAQDVAKAKSVSFFAQVTQKLTSESNREKLERKTEKTAKDALDVVRDDRIELLRRRIPYCQERRQDLMADSLVSRFDANDVRELAFVRWCRLHHPSQNELCGTATITDSEAASGIVDVDRDIKFEVLISGEGTQSLATSVRFTGFCPVSPGSREHLMFAQAFSENHARRIEDDVKNALFNGFKDVEPETANVPTTARISYFGAKVCDPVGQRDVVVTEVTEEADLNSSCCFPSKSCSLLGGAKKIKRAQQSKKKKARRSKSKSKRVRRKNKSRRI